MITSAITSSATLRVLLNGALKTGIKALLYDRIVQSFHDHKEKGYWPIHARETMGELTAQYRALGGNGVVQDLLDSLRELPTEKEGAGGEE